MASVNHALGLIAGTVADAVLGDPKRHHPVAWFGSWVCWLESRIYRDSVARGALFTATALAPVAALGIAADKLTRAHPLAHTALTAAAISCCPGRSAPPIPSTAAARIASVRSGSDTGSTYLPSPTVTAQACGAGPTGFTAGCQPRQGCAPLACAA